MSERAIGMTSLVLCLLAASTFVSFAKVLSGTFSPLSLVFVSESLNALFIFFSFGLLPTLKRLSQLHKAQFVPLLAMGMLSGVMGPMLWFFGLEMTSAVNASLFAKSDIIFVLILAYFVLGERIERVHFLSIAAVLCGVLFVTLRGFNQGITLQPGDFIVIAGTLCYASSNIVYRKFLIHLEPQIALLIRCFTAIGFILALSPFAELQLFEQLARFPLELLPALIGFAFISRFLNSMLFYEACAYLPAVTISLFGTLEILGSATFAFLYLGERIEWYHVVGGLFLILGNVLLSLFRSPAVSPNATNPAQSVNMHQPAAVA